MSPASPAPGRDEANTRTEADRELREQVVAALLNPWTVTCPNCAALPGVACLKMPTGDAHTQRAADAVMVPVDAWVAAHTAEAAALNEAMEEANEDGFGWRPRAEVAEAAVARVRALCDMYEQIARRSAGIPKPPPEWIAKVRAALDEPTGGA